MLRCAVSYLLTLAICLQGLCSLHADQCTHDRAPHIHVGVILGEHHDDNDDCPDPSDEHHGDDAVYVPALVMLSKPVQMNVNDLAISAPAPEPVFGNLPVLASSHFLTHSPPMACPIYLEMLTLLI